jgi:hypothetical protein
VDSQVSLPRWAYLSVGYALFLWASIEKISLRDLRADMLLSGFVYLAAALLVRMRGREARWGDYTSLGFVLGIGFLAKEPLLPLGLLILAAIIGVGAQDSRRDLMNEPLIDQTRDG